MHGSRGQLWALQVTIIEPVVEIARRAQVQGIPIAVASGGSTAHVTEGLRIAGILHMFEIIVCAEVRGIAGPENQSLKNVYDLCLNPSRIRPGISI